MSDDSREIGALTRRLAAGDEAAYRMFFELYLHRLSRYLLVVTAGDEHAMRDALQETLTRVVRHIKPFAEESAFWSWLTVLARSACFDARRKRRRYLAFLDRFNRYASFLRPDEIHREDDQQLENLLRQNLQLLPPDERALLESKYLLQCSVREIAERAGTTEKAIESRLGRIRRKLKDAVLAEMKRGART